MQVLFDLRKGTETSLERSGVETWGLTWMSFKSWSLKDQEVKSYVTSWTENIGVDGIDLAKGKMVSWKTTSQEIWTFLVCKFMTL